MSKEEKKTTKVVNSEEHNNLIKLFKDENPENRQKILNDIDEVLCVFLNFKQNELPWINPKKHTVKWGKIFKEN